MEIKNLSNNFESVIEAFTPYVSKFFKPTDDEEIMSNDWKRCMANVDGAELLGAFSNNINICCLQFRKLTKNTDNYTCSYPNKRGYYGDIIVEVSYAPHQHWEYYDMNKTDDIKKLIYDLNKI